MYWSIDHLIFFSFLIINIIFGLRTSRGVTTLAQYSLGDRNFTTATLVSTLVATWVCGEFFYTILIETYKNGLYSLIPLLCNTLSFLSIFYYFAPRMGEFLGKMSIAEAMGDLYGEKVRLITSVAGFICVAGIIAVQLKIAGSIFEYVLNVKSIYGILLAGFIVTLYSTLGGIKSVTFTDVIQFFAFGTIIPVITYFFFTRFVDSTNILTFINEHPNYNLSKVLDISDNKFWSMLFLCFYMAIPSFNPAIFQRISMCRNVRQVQRSFYILSFFVFVLTLIVAWLGVVLNYNFELLNDNDVIKTLFDNTPPVYKGLLLIGIMAMIMSTIDSYINSSSVLITHDFLNVFRKLNDELLTARIVSFLLGTIGILLSLKDIGIFRLIVLSSSFYMCTVTVPFIMAILGYRTPYKGVVISGIFAGILVNTLWIILNITVIDGVIPAMFANWLVLVIMHKYYHSKNCQKKISY
jgi:Na+/proline symporter